MDHYMWSNSNVESWESYPQVLWSFVCDSLSHGVEDVFIGVFTSLFVDLHFLHSYFHIIERTGHGGGKETSETFGKHFSLNTVGVITAVVLEHLSDLSVGA